jgi:hypothetical protein
MSLEQSLRGQKPADRVRMLRLLKSGTVKSVKECAPLVGYSVIQLTRLLGTLSGRGTGRAAQAAQASRDGFAHDGRGMGGLAGRDAKGAYSIQSTTLFLINSCCGRGIKLCPKLIVPHSYSSH